MTEELCTYNQRCEIADKHFDCNRIKLHYLDEINKAFLPGQTICYLAINAEGQIQIKGSCPNIETAALTASKLQELPFIMDADLKAADLNEESSGVYAITASLVFESGGDQNGP